MSNRGRLPLHIGDNETDTRHLTPAEYGCYVRLRDRYWTDGGPIPLDHRWLAMVAGCRVDVWKRLAPRVVAMFVEIDGKLHHKRLEWELAQQRRRQDRLKKGNGVPAPAVQQELPDLHNSCGAGLSQKPNEIKARAVPHGGAPTKPPKKENLVGTGGVSDTHARPPPDRSKEETDQGLGRARGADPPAARVVPIIAPKPFALSRRRPRDGPEALQDVLDRLMRHATGRGG